MEEEDHHKVLQKKRKKKRPSRGQRVSKKKRQSELNYNETDYVFHGGKRCVVAYTFLHETYVKRTWCGRKLLDVFMEDFGTGSPECYVCLPILFLKKRLTKLDVVSLYNVWPHDH